MKNNGIIYWHLNRVTVLINQSGYHVDISVPYKLNTSYTDKVRTALGEAIVSKFKKSSSQFSSMRHSINTWNCDISYNQFPIFTMQFDLFE